jgi:5-formyltetrahydrofolate cyclo-ligase
MADDRSALRRCLRAARRAVAAAERPRAAAAIDRALASLGLPRPGSRISAFHPFDGEIDPSVVLARAHALGCSIYYPDITSLRARRMRFVSSDEDAATEMINPRWLDLVLVPLVGFDASGTRLGMGAGFYDRHFAFLRHRRTWQRPRLLGLAFDVQRVERLADAAHDVPLWGIVTELGIYGRAALHSRKVGRTLLR